MASNIGLPVARNDMYALDPSGVVADAKPKFLVHLRSDLNRQAFSTVIV